MKWVLLALLASGCTGTLIARRDAARMLPRFTTCPDGEAVRLLLDARCPGGVCGYSCLPGRWNVIRIFEWK